MKLTTLTQITNWFEKYQPIVTAEEKLEMYKLYEKLIEEEYAELDKAYKEQDLVEFLDALWDTLWVILWQIYFSDDTCMTEKLDFYLRTTISLLAHNTEYKRVTWYNLINEILEEIISSNYSKSLEQQTDWEKKWKIIKGKNFKKPDLQKIIDKYEIKWKPLEVVNSENWEKE